MIANNCTNIHFFLIAISSYLIGSIPFAILISRFLELDDPRNFGSKNPGTTNMLRTGNKIAAISTLLGDMAKGFIALKIPAMIDGASNPKLITISSIFVILGHIYPIFANFKGGKGVATFFGILIATSPLLSIFSLLLWIITAYIWKYSSLASITTVIIVTIYYAVSYTMGTTDGATLISITIISLILIYKHKSNIKKLINSTESHISL